MFCVSQEALAISYFPGNQGIPIKYFPYTGGNYQAPLGRAFTQN